MDKDTLIQKEKQYLMGTYGRFDVLVESGQNATLWSADGKKYIDFSAGIGVLSLGTAHEEWSRAVAAQSAKLGHISNLFYTEPMITLAEKLCCASGLKKVFFANSGAEANEGAIKIARKYSFDKYGKGRSDIIALQNSFHGRTLTTLSATGQERFHNYFFPFTEGFSFVPANDEAALKAALTESTCAVMIEMIQGEGGVLPLDAEYIWAVARLCREHDLLLIVDEVQTGIGRTGSLFAYQQAGISPDVVTCAKGLGGGLPLGAVLAGEKCCHTLGNGDHGSTFGGNPVACAAANVVLDTVNRDAFLSEVFDKGAHIRYTLESWRLPAVKDIRGRGLMIGVIVEPGLHKKYVAEMVARGLLVLTAGDSAIRLLPPLTISYGEIKRGLAIMKEVLEKEIV